MKSYNRKITPVANKKCSYCKITKSSDEFHRNKNYADGIDKRCKSCKKNENKKIKLNNKITISSKQCKSCNEIKLIDSYHKDASRRDGYSRICKLCAIQNVSKWAKENSHRSTKNKQLYRAKKFNARPDWLSKEHIEDIDFIYWFSEQIKGLHGNNYHVDHIHALQGKNFSGLHVPWNLQVLSSSSNIAKGNRPPREEAETFWENVN
jgi:hypothetical protein